MKLQDALKTSLDELRMQMLGGQVLFGFQFQAMFQDNFRAVPHSGRVVYALEDLKAWADRGAKTSTSDPCSGTVLPAKRHAAGLLPYAGQVRR